MSLKLYTPDTERQPAVIEHRHEGPGGLYSVGTWNTNKQAYTPQRGLTVPSFNITLAQLRQAIRDLRRLGYTAYRVRNQCGAHSSDPDVLIERTDGQCWRQIMRAWKH